MYLSTRFPPEMSQNPLLRHLLKSHIAASSEDKARYRATKLVSSPG